MRLKCFAIVALILGLAGTPQAARADYFVWNHPQTGLQITYPDTWKQVSNQDYNDVLTVMAPSGRAHATCRVRIDDERRFLIYPPRYGDAVQKINFSDAFWDRYLQEYDNHSIDVVADEGGLGKGFASYAIASFDSAIPGPDMSRRALLFVSNYNDKLYVVECSSHADAFEEWKHLFLSVAGSVEFRKISNELTVGHYRNFLKDRNLLFKDTDGNKRPFY